MAKKMKEKIKKEAKSAKKNKSLVSTLGRPQCLVPVYGIYSLQPSILTKKIQSKKINLYNINSLWHMVKLVRNLTAVI